ncbi:hypothetical protein OEZ85_006944 [Tetradesmus obliquus]|uniref:ABC transporter domain-containing protein n=1 Tax=Tetradesmus obliquus TaxID=3088 RepID=A0ABY8TW44_TETOB|nr:hypothetical protein OEZ85_006944 [Tetradesmus obliquus]
MTNSSTARRWQLVQFGCETDGLLLERAGHSATVVGSKVYVFGGRKGSKFYNDLLVFDTATSQWSLGPRCPCKPRANHTATLIGSKIWIIGGMNDNDVYSDVFYLDLVSSSWKQAHVEDPQQLLMRCAHAAEVHPRRPATIIVFGGYSRNTDPEEDRELNMTDELLLLHTDRGVVEHVQSFKGQPPSRRGYHSMSMVGDRAFIYGGRHIHGIVPNDAALFIYDVLDNAWYKPDNVSGTAPLTRSSHRAVTYHGRIIVYGGAVQDNAGAKERLGDVYSLVVAGAALCWSQCDSPAPCEDMPRSRSAHTMHLVGDVLYLMLGYAGSGKQTTYVQDCWALPLVPDAYQRMMNKARGKQLSPSAVLQATGAQPAAAAAAASEEYLHELDSLREQLQQQLARSSRLEGEARQLALQLGQLREERQAAEAALQAQRGEAAGLRVAKEAAVSEKLRLQEELVHLQQQLESGRQQRSKLEHERDSILSDKQSCYKEAQRLQTQLQDAQRERRAVQEALSAQQEKQRRAEEAALQQRQQQQQALLEMSASLEATKNELRRLNDAAADEQRKHDAATSQLRAEAAAREAALQERSRQAAELAQQLEAAGAALAEQQRKAESFRQLQQTSAQQLEALRHTHTGVAAEKLRLEGELGKLREELERARADLDQKTAAANQALSLGAKASKDEWVYTRPKRAPLDNEYILGIALQHKQHLLVAAVTVVLCTVSNLAAPVLSGMLFEHLVQQHPMERYAKVFGVLLVGYLLEPLLTRVYMVNIIAAGEKVLATLRMELFRTLLMQKIEFYDRHSATALQSLISTELDTIRTFIFNNCSRDRGLRAFLEAAGAVVVLFCLSWRLAPAVSIVIVVTAVAAALYRRSTRPVEAAQSAALQRMAGVAYQAFQNMRTVRSFAGEALERERFQSEVVASFAAGRQFGAAKATFEATNRMAIHLSLLMLYAWGGYLVSHGMMPIGVLVSGIGFTFSLMYATQGAVNTLSELRRASGAFDRVRRMIQASDPDPSMYGALPPGAWWEVANGAEPVFEPYADKAGEAAVAAARQGDLELVNVSFSYPVRKEMAVLRDINLQLKHGTVTALVGRSGAGKSTVAALLSRFYEPQVGNIRLAGRPTSDFSRGEWARAVAMVSQEPVLFSGSIADNIAYGKFGRCSAEEIQAAAEAANAHEFITELPEGYNTLVGDRGTLLSGGQRQRIAIARALLKDSPIIILDEATSALDAVSEKLVQGAIQRLVQGRTVLVIAHRLSTVQSADQIVVMKAGRIAEKGTHNELLANHSHYSELMSSQEMILGASV